MQYKRLPQFLTKDINGRIVTGIAAVHGNVDSGGDMSLNGSFNDWLTGNGRKRAKHLWNHDSWTPPTASLKSVREVKRGELPTAVTDYAPDATGGVEVVREYYPPEVSELAGWILHGIKAGDINEMSYAYDINESGSEMRGPVRVLKSLDIFDFSDVQWGMNPATAGAKWHGQQPQRKGEALAAFLNRTIDGMVSDDQIRADIIQIMADAAGIDAGTVNQILNAEIIRPPDDRLRGFADALNVSFSRLQELANQDAAKCWLPDNLRFAESADLARIATAAFKKRVFAIDELRKSNGRHLSDRSKGIAQELIQTLEGEIEALQALFVEPTSILALRARAAELALDL